VSVLRDNFLLRFSSVMFSSSLAVELRRLYQHVEAFLPVLLSETMRHSRNITRINARHRVDDDFRIAVAIRRFYPMSNIRDNNTRAKGRFTSVRVLLFLSVKSVTGECGRIKTRNVIRPSERHQH